MTGFIYIASLIFLAFVVVTVYTLARDLHATRRATMLKMLRRSAQLFGLLAGLAAVVFVLSQV